MYNVLYYDIAPIDSFRAVHGIYWLITDREVARLFGCRLLVLRITTDTTSV